MNNDLELIKITEKLQERCHCFDCEDGATMQGYVKSFLSVLARMFCWADSECSSILKTCREEVIEVKDLTYCGCDAMMEIKPYYYKGFDPSTLTVYLQKRQGLEREVYELTDDYFNWSFIDGTLLVNLTEWLNPCCRCIDLCSCEAEYKLVLTYDAGYTSETIPDCVYDSLCHFIRIFVAYQNKCGTLEECANMDRLAVGSVLKQKSVDYIVREWVIDKESIDRVYTRLVQKWSLQTLSSLSLCRSVPTDNMFLIIGRDRKC